MDLTNLILYSIYFMIPAYFANGSALVFGGGKPLDCGCYAGDGRRLVGDGVTWRGIIGGGLLGMITGGILGLLADYNICSYYFSIAADQITFLSGNIAEGLFIGLILGFGALIGDAVGSYIKRRLNFERGRPVPLLDQLDFIIVSLIFISTVIRVDFLVIITILLVSIILHLAANMFAYMIHLKDVWY